MKDGLKYTIGKQIAGVVVVSSARSPKRQVFLVFTDGSRFEFWGENFSCCAGLDSAGGIERYVQSGKGKVDRVFGEPPKSVPAGSTLTTGRESTPYHVAATETLEGLMTRDVAAWREAKALIDRAKRN